MLTVLKNGQWTGTQYPDTLSRKQWMEAVDHHTAQGDVVIETTTAIVRDPGPNGEITTPPPTAQEISDGQALVSKLYDRPVSAETRLKTILSLQAVRSIKTLADAESFVDGQVTDLATARAMMSKILFFSINVGRFVLSDEDDIFPTDE